MWYQKKENIIKMIVVILVVILGISSAYFLGDDNPVEETSEEVIKAQTGIDVDLTPKSPEKQ
jgi:uncharacterized protein YpmB